MMQANLKVHGKVQGVFYRLSVLEKANDLELFGWVKNIDDGTVDILLEGPKEKIEEFIEWCKKGPKRASVEKVDENIKNITKITFNDFNVIY